VYLPQEDGLLISDLLNSGMTPEHASSVIFKNDVNAIRQCDILLILLDGRAVDEGAAFELGLAYQMGKTCIGLQTDFRRLAPFGSNPMLSGAIDTIFSKPADLVAWIKQYAEKSILS
jgi:nucleoside 2-deoxyribosyltransferase